ncbi:MAG: MmcQ/YjbR family DNA-binding protein, partial [Terracidiphilus sp.]
NLFRSLEASHVAAGVSQITFEQVRKIALALPNVEESTSYGTAAFKTNGKLLARLKEDGDSLVLGTTFEERDEMISADPETYYITDHYLKYPWILVRLSRVSPETLRDLLNRALRLASTKDRRAPKRRRTS